MSPRRRLSVVLAVAALGSAGAGVVGPASAGAQGDTSAVAVNTKDGSSVFRLAFAIRRVMGDVVDQQNAAVAYASCTECQTVALSIQVLLVMGDPSVVDPTNLAIAINQDCTLCQTLASAYQFVVGYGTRLMLTPAGRQELQRIRRQLNDLRRSGLSIQEIQARTDALMDELRQTLSRELVIQKPRQGQEIRPHESSGDSRTQTPQVEPPQSATGPSQQPAPSQGETTTTTPPSPSSSPPSQDSSGGATTTP